jgi:hypothetical protein
MADTISAAAGSSDGAASRPSFLTIESVPAQGDDRTSHVAGSAYLTQPPPSLIISFGTVSTTAQTWTGSGQIMFGALHADKGTPSHDLGHALSGTIDKL